MTLNKDKTLKEYLTLKWGTLKAWEFHNPKCIALLKEYGKIGSSMSAIMQHDTPRQKEIICELIDMGNFKKVFLDWDDKYIPKEEAKKYVLDYDKEDTK
jgi:hypothetical protein